jgi:hypothetical protein
LSPQQPKSAVIGILLKPSTSPEDEFRDYSIAVISSRVAELVNYRFIRDLWNTIQDPDKGWAIFEAYTRRLMVAENQSQPAREKRTLEGRACVGKSDPLFEVMKNFELGGCTQIRLALDIVAAAMQQPLIVYHSVNRQFNLIDFVYQDEGGVFHAFQVTLGKKHDCKPADVLNLYNQLQQGASVIRLLKLYLLVRGEQYPYFVTNPVNPMESLSGVQVEIFHVLVPNPQ